MTIRTLFAITLTASLATACVVAGEEDPTLEEIEACSKPDPDRTGKFSVTLIKEGKEVSYDSLTRDERESLDLAVETIRREGDDDEWECENYDNGDWYCTNRFVECLCREDPGYCECWDVPGC